MKRTSAFAAMLLVAVTLVSTADAGKWHRWGRRSGFGWSDGYHAPSRGAHFGAGPPSYWEGVVETPAVDLAPAPQSCDLIPTPAEMMPQYNGAPNPTAARPQWRGMRLGY